MLKPDPFDFDALLAFHQAQFGDAVMSTPAGEAPPAAPSVSDIATGGVLVGADPRPTFTPVAAGQNPATVQALTPEEVSARIEAARKQEKDKLYPQLEELKGTVSQLQKERDERLEAERKAREEAEQALEEQRRQELTLSERLEEQAREFEQRFQSLQQEREQERAILDMERAFQELQVYKGQALAAASEDIIPELAAELTATNHTSREEVDSHIARLKATSESIMNSMQAAVQAQRAGMRGAPVTAPPAGPLDTYSGHDPALEAAANGSLTFEDFVKNRDKLLPAASRFRNSGMFG